MQCQFCCFGRSWCTQIRIHTEKSVLNHNLKTSVRDDIEPTCKIFEQFGTTIVAYKLESFFNPRPSGWNRSHWLKSFPLSLMSVYTNVTSAKCIKSSILLWSLEFQSYVNTGPLRIFHMSRFLSWPWATIIISARMKTISFLAIKTALSDNCNPGEDYPAQLRCWDDCDLSYRDCLREFDCHVAPNRFH